MHILCWHNKISSTYLMIISIDLNSLQLRDPKSNFFGLSDYMQILNLFLDLTFLCLKFEPSNLDQTVPTCMTAWLHGSMLAIYSIHLTTGTRQLWYKIACTRLTGIFLFIKSTVRSSTGLLAYISIFSFPLNEYFYGYWCSYLGFHLDWLQLYCYGQ
jgi:hypothetical protein